jgi:hypothetical protein
MALGDGIRRDIQLVSQQERDRFIAAILQLDTTRFYPDGVSYWDKQEDIHKNAHAAGADVHGGPAFLGWHRELCNRLEGLIREVDPELSLHYWDWTVDPRSTAGGRTNLFTTQFMGSANGDAGPPLQDFESTEGGGHTHIWRQLLAGAPAIASDHDIIHASDGVSQPAQYEAFLGALNGAHGYAHSTYIGGTIAQEHYSFHDPFVFLLHSNVDRLWAMWQTQAGAEWRLDPAQTYGTDGVSPSSSINTEVQPWAGDEGTGFTPLRPWGPPENQQVHKTYKDITIVAPPCYDTLPTTVQVVDAENPGGVIQFNDVPQGETTVRAAVFKVFACTDVTLQVSVSPAAPYSVLTPGGSIVVHHGAELFREGRIWFSFTGGAPGTTAPTGNVTIHCVETGQDFAFTIVGNSIARPTVATILVLDQSGSMAWPAGTTGATRIQVLHEAASQFVQLVPGGDGVGIVRFDNNAYQDTPVQTFGTGIFDPNRTTALGKVQAITPNGATSIGNGLDLARSILDPVTGFDQKAVIVFTDGLENTSKFIADVMPLINDRTFAIGLGNQQQVSTGALTTLTNQTGGYLLLSGLLSASTDDYFRLSKYFLQVLAGVTNQNIILDPTGVLDQGTRIRIPFVIGDSDIDATVVLLTDTVPLPFDLETPDGEIVRPATAGMVGTEFAVGYKMSYYRFTLPMLVGAKAASAGTWHALLGFEEDRLAQRAAIALPRRVRYSLLVHTYSNLRLTARMVQTSLEPGAKLSIEAQLTEYRAPVEGRATVMATVQRPDGSSMLLPMAEQGAGRFGGSFMADQTGVYRARVQATGVTWRGLPFTREQEVTGAAFPGGNAPFPTSGPGDGAGAEAWCQLAECLLDGALAPLLRRENVDPQALLKCVRGWCEARTAGPTPEELARRESTA